MLSSALTPDNLQQQWNSALDYWGVAINVSSPIDLAKITTNKDENGPIAYIDMKSRQVVYNKKWFEENKVNHCLTGVFAHELGHHLKFPATLKTSAELLLLAEKIIPGLPYYHLNIFWDLLVNEFVGRDPSLREQLKGIYKVTVGPEMTNYYRRYLGIYEALWRCEDLYDLQLDGNARAANRDFVETFYQLANFYEQFLYFLSHFIILFPLEELMLQQPESDPFGGDAQAPSADDFPMDDKEPSALKKALKKAAEKGWLEENSSNHGDRKSSWKKISDVMSRLPGSQSSPELLRATYLYYRHQVEKLIELMPKQIKSATPDTFLPSVHADWDTGDDVQAIDWIGSYARSGAYAPAFLLKRELIPDDQVEQIGYFKPKIEIYLDTSGSMPSPMQDVNSMTLAALLLSTYAIRKHGSARGTVYSVESIDSEWMNSEARAQEFFLNYYGSGTEFPFETLGQRSAQDAKVHRVIISDGDFLHNVGYRGYTRFPDEDKGRLKTLPLLKSSLTNSLSLTFLLHGVSLQEFQKTCGKEISQHSKCRFISVSKLDDFVPMAAALASALFGDLS